MRFIGGQKGAEEEALGLLSAFEKLRKVAVSFVMYVCPFYPSVRMGKLGPPLVGFS